MNKTSWWAVVPVGIVLLAVVAVAGFTVASEDQVADLKLAGQWAFAVCGAGAGLACVGLGAMLAREASEDDGDSFILMAIGSAVVIGFSCLLVAIGTSMMVRLYFGMEPFTP